MLLTIFRAELLCWTQWLRFVWWWDSVGGVLEEHFAWHTVLWCSPVFANGPLWTFVLSVANDRSEPNRWIRISRCAHSPHRKCRSAKSATLPRGGKTGHSPETQRNLFGELTDCEQNCHLKLTVLSAVLLTLAYWPVGRFFPVGSAFHCLTRTILRRNS